MSQQIIAYVSTNFVFARDLKLKVIPQSSNIIGPRGFPRVVRLTSKPGSINC